MRSISSIIHHHRKNDFEGVRSRNPTNISVRYYCTVHYCTVYVVLKQIENPSHLVYYKYQQHAACKDEY